MPNPRKPSPEDRLNRIVADARRVQEEREQTYRGQALKLFPPICARCGREFSGKRLRELTVHHKDHDHDHNPPDGSNWELLCLYCHENEHARQAVAEAYAPGRPGGSPGSGEGFKAFADLAALLEARRKGGEG
jgi:hypothetical protein